MHNLPLGKNTDAPLQFKAGTVIFTQGEDSKYLFFVKKGQIRLLKKNGQHLKVIKLCQEKEILNEVSVLTNKPMAFSAIAKTDIELVLVDKKDILAVIKAGHSWIPDIFKTLCERLVSTLEIIEEHNLMAGETNSDVVLTKEEEMKCLSSLVEYEGH